MAVGSGRPLSKVPRIFAHSQVSLYPLDSLKVN